MLTGCRWDRLPVPSWRYVARAISTTLWSAVVSAGHERITSYDNPVEPPVEDVMTVACSDRSWSCGDREILGQQ